MFMTEKEEENLYFNNLGLDYDESISLFNKKEIMQDKNELNLKESKNILTTFCVKKVIKKKKLIVIKNNYSFSLMISFMYSIKSFLDSSSSIANSIEVLSHSNLFPMS